MPYGEQIRAGTPIPDEAAAKSRKRNGFARGRKPQRQPPGALRLSTKEKAMGNAFGKNVMQARINALTVRSADSRVLKTAKHIEESGLRENRSMRRHAKKEQQRMARSK